MTRASRKRTQFIINGEIFATKRALKDRVRSILYGCELGQALGAVGFAFMRDLLNRHPEAQDKIGRGVAAIKVMAALYGTRCFVLQRVDGTETDFSFVACIDGHTHEQDVRAALRNAVQAQQRECRARAFAGKTRIPCPVTGEAITSDEAHVDHAPPNTFDVLMAAFLEAENLKPADIEVDGAGDGEMFATLRDEALAARWQEFHRERADLRVVSKRANLSVLREERLDLPPEDLV